MKVGFFYQSAYNYVACYMALNQLRKHYPNSPVVLYEDNGDILKEVGDKFNCVYKKTDVRGKKLTKFMGRSVFDLNTNLAWLKRIYTECNTTLKDVDWIVHYEDDVWCMREIKEEPNYDIQGANGPHYTKEMGDYLAGRYWESRETRGPYSDAGSLYSYGACGGSIFNREKFIQAYENAEHIDWAHMQTLDERVCRFSDASLTFIFQYSNFTYSQWNEFGRYDAKDTGYKMDKTGWSVPLSQQVDCAFLHPFKHFYNYEKEELQIALDKKL